MGNKINGFDPNVNKKAICDNKKKHSSGNNKNTIVFSIPDLQSSQITAKSRSLVKRLYGGGGC